MGLHKYRALPRSSAFVLRTSDPPQPLNICRTKCLRYSQSIPILENSARLTRWASRIQGEMEAIFKPHEKLDAWLVTLEGQRATISEQAAKAAEISRLF